MSTTNKERSLSSKIVLIGIAGASCLLAFWFGRVLPKDPASANHETNDQKSAMQRSVMENRRSRISRAAPRPHPERKTEASRSLAIINRIDGCLTREDFMDVLSSILLNSDKTEKGRHLALLFAGWLEEDPETALSEVRRVELLRHDWARTGSTFTKWATENPSEALDLLRTSLDGRQLDPSASPPFLDGVDPPEFLFSIVHGLADSDPVNAGKFLAEIADSPVKTNAMEVLVQQWFSAEPGQVYEWAASVTDSKARDQALQIAGTKAGQLDDPSLGLEWAQSLPNEADQLKALRPLINQWAGQRPADALEWAAKLPDGDTKFSVMPDVIYSLTVIDADAAADWLDQYEASPQIDDSVEAYSLSVGQWSPVTGLGSADVITDAAQRERTLIRIYENWATTDPAASQAYLDNEPNLPAGLRELVSPQ